MGERPNDPTVGDAESAGAVGDRKPGQQIDQRAENVNSHQPAERLPVLAVAQESRPHHQVGISFEQLIDQPADLTGTVLAVAVDLHRKVVPV